MDTPLTLGSIVTSWRWDAATVAITAGLAVGYSTARARGGRVAVPVGRAASFLGLGLGVWLLSGVGVIGVYSGSLFWVRALQTLLLLYVVPFGLAAGRPVTVLRAALGPVGQARLDRALASPGARALTYPLVPSAAVLTAPWLLFLTPWYELVLRHGSIDALTRILLVAIGFLYFYSRLQTDPVPRRFNQSVSLLITVFESMADGILGLVLWFGPLVAVGYYTEVGRSWGPDLRMDQTIAAGVIWVLGDVLGLPYLLALMRAWAFDERRRAVEVDAEIDATEKDSVRPEAAETELPQGSGLWWEHDPQLRARFRR
ncbi:cytochrome c oxidase assembly protein [Nocardia sp. CDC159]|uniref:Cytochrome c oxidase assembly protein n=1 Tax=Nocardia pulmonis TaxID=2951408 RepID=A0A9X2IWF2_9NOCA|nr:MULTISPECIES: cytochrome c oxidase assembly protein [Nocardia]MCM6774248.1 cytochrome c oxidase assembly protein [Nocardia pulmonis]MCM6787135.1 cytochrome c oxidase assembly protein [Nocardia sp. CDC159]